MGNPPIEYTHLSVMLSIEIFQRCYGKEIVLPVLSLPTGMGVIFTVILLVESV